MTFYSEFYSFSFLILNTFNKRVMYVLLSPITSSTISYNTYGINLQKMKKTVTLRQQFRKKV